MLSTVRVGNFPISFISRVAIKHFPCSEFWTDGDLFFQWSFDQSNNSCIYGIVNNAISIRNPFAN